MKRSKNNRTALGPDVRKLWDYRDLPIGITAIGFEQDMPKTGAWRSIRPLGLEKLAPCQEACPAGMDIRGFIKQIRLKKYSEAYHLIQDENPLSRICGRVCFHPCESKCNRSEFDEPVSIRSLERFASEVSSDRKNRAVSIWKRKRERVAVIGSGPAGLSCAYYLARMGYRPHLFEARPKLGGLLRFGIPGYRLPKSVLDEEIKKVLDLGVTYETGKRLGGNLKLEDLKKYDAVYLGIGAWNELKLTIPNEAGVAPLPGIDFLEKVNSQGPFKMRGQVVVIGGGNTAIDVARSILRLGGKPLILYRRSREEMPASAEEIIEAEEEGIPFQFLTSPVRIEREKHSGLRLECVKNRLSTKEESGRRIPIKIKDSNFYITAHRVIYALGQRVVRQDLPEDLRIDRTTSTVWVDGLFQTSIPKLFAGGDAALNSRSVASAIGSAKKAAMAMDRYLTGQRDEELFEKLRLGEGGSISMLRYLNGERISNPKGNEVVRFQDLNVHYFDVQDRMREHRLPSSQRRKTFNEVNPGFTQDRALKEADRCFSCGSCSFCDNCYIFCPEVVVRREVNGNEIDLDYCKGCGICVSECPVGFIRMEPEVNE